MKIKFGQKYFRGNRDFTELMGVCYYYLAYDDDNQTFYRLGGFEKLDLKDFFKNFEVLKATLTIEESEVDLFCLYEYSDLSEKKKLRKPFDCFKSCEDEIIQQLVIPKKQEP